MAEIHIITILFIAAFLVQALFDIYYFYPFLYSEITPGKKLNEKKEVSVIICAHNELPNLQEHLPLFLTQKHGNYEVIVVNDRSNDGSKEWLADQENAHDHLKVLNISETPSNFNSKKYALSVGIEFAKNEILLFSDADCEPASPYWVDRMSQCFTHSKTIVLGVSLYQKSKGFLNQFIRFETLQTALLYLAFAFKGNPYMGVGRNLAYKKSFFLKKGGFDNIQSIMGGDDDLWVNNHANMENTNICTDPEGLTFSKPKESWAAFFQQKKRHLSVGKYYKIKDKLILGLFHFSQSMLWILFILGCILGNPTDCLILTLVMVLHIIGQYVVFYKLSINFGNSLEHSKVPLLQILFIGYYWIWGLYATLTKNLKWK